MAEAGVQELKGSQRCGGGGTRQPLSPAERSGLQAASGRGCWRESLKCQAKTIAFSGQREIIMEGSEQEKHTIAIPALLQESSPGSGVTGIAVAMPGAGGPVRKPLQMTR